MNTVMAWLRTPTAGSVQMTRTYVGHPADLPARWARPGIARTAFDFLPHYDPERVELLERCLAVADPPDLVGVLRIPRLAAVSTTGFAARRGTKLLFPGDPARFKRWMPARMRAIREREVAAFRLADEAAQRKEA